MGRIACGVDGSDGALRALRWALAEGVRRGWEVEVVHAWQTPFLVASPVVVEPEVDLLEEAAGAVLDEAIRTASASAGAGALPALRRTVARGGPGEALLAAAEGADLLVVGSRGRSGVARLLLGSVSHQVLHHAPCSVVVVPTGGDGDEGAVGADGRTVVGVDGSEPSVAALAWAIERAAAGGGGAVHAVMAWSYLDQHGTFDPTLGEAQVQAALDAVLARARPVPEGVALTGAIVNDLAADAIVGAAGDAALVVVGARGLGGFKGLLVGSVSNHVVHDAHRPVVVVRAG